MKTILAAMLVLCFVVATPAIAGVEDDLVRNIDDYFTRIKDKLDGIVSDSSSSDIDYALEYLNNVKDYVDKLRALSPQNDPAKTMAYY